MYLSLEKIRLPYSDEARASSCHLGGQSPPNCTLHTPNTYPKKDPLMKLSEFKSALNSTESLSFTLPDRTSVPAHFHITEAGLTTKHFIDCGGTVRKEKYVTLQLWTAEDYDHRLSSEKLARILKMAAPLFEGEDPEVEVEFQRETVGRYGTDFARGAFLLTAKETDCLAKETCGIPEKGGSRSDSERAAVQTASCTPGGGCC